MTRYPALGRVEDADLGEVFEQIPGRLGVGQVDSALDELGAKSAAGCEDPAGISARAEAQ